MSDRCASGDFGKLSRIQNVPGVHGESLRKFVGPQCTGNGVTNRASDTGPKGEQGDCGTHVSMGDGSLYGNLGSNNGTSTLFVLGRPVSRDQEQCLDIQRLTPNPTKI